MNGGSVIAVKYGEGASAGVLMAADTLLAYGSLAKQVNVPRIKIVGKTSAVCASGDYADFGEMMGELGDIVEGTRMEVDTSEPSPKQLFNYMHRSVYNSRCDFEPKMCKFVLCGVDPNTKEPFIGVTDSVGTRWTDDCAAAGMAAYNALTLVRRALETKNGAPLSREEAVNVIHDCCRVIFYRECRAINRFQIADATAEKVTISDPFIVETRFDFEGFKFEKTAIIR